MESTVNDFLDEINEIIPLKKSSSKKKEKEWTECFDSKSGFTYYWNTKTNEVTWQKPLNFVGNSAITGPIPNIPDLKDKVKIYKLSGTQPVPKPNGNLPRDEPKKAPGKKKPFQNDSDDEKITLITSYGSSSSSESENESEDTKNTKQEEQKDNEEDDILSTVLKRAEELKKLGNVDLKTAPKLSEETKVTSKTSKPISGFSLVAGYDSNSEEENENDTKQVVETNKPTLPPTPTQGHSTLFPIMKTPDINDFKEEENVPKKEENKCMDSSFDMKNFKRKRRLAVSFVPTRSNVRPPSPKSLDSERKGFGFKDAESAGENSGVGQSKSLYSNFTKGSVAFVTPESKEDGKTEDGENVDEKKITEVYEILREKLAFLCEGNKDVMPVQIILIQIETLYGALRAESLNPKYLQDWLEGTSEDLIKLEKEAAPENWSLRWDRLEKRYYYHNEATGQTQWEYPREDFERDEEAMDICTTPPPPEIMDPKIEERTETSDRIPSPPPAPIISQLDSEIIPEPPSAPSSSKVLPTSQPLPPGVDSTESTSHEVKDIDSAFNSFYSELAEIEKTSKPSSPSNVNETVEPEIERVEETAEPVKKKKKKMKLGQGLSLKNKDVSKLVEKWKNVQNNL